MVYGIRDFDMMTDYILLLLLLLLHKGSNLMLPIHILCGLFKNVCHMNIRTVNGTCYARLLLRGTTEFT
jgi:hypothetical protein